MAHQLDDLADLPLGHAVRGFPAGSRRHRALIGVDIAVSQQVQVLIEHLSVELVTRQALPAAVAEDFKYRPGVLHYAYLTVPKKIRHLCPFALWSGSPGLQIGRPLPLRLLRALCRLRTRVP